MLESPPSSGDDPGNQIQIKNFDDHSIMILDSVGPFHETTTIAIAGHEHVFEVDKALICQCSKFFAAAFSHPMKESKDNKIELHNVSPNIFRKFIDCISNENNLLDVTLDVDIFFDWIQLYKFADFVDVRKLCNDITSIAYDWFRTKYQLPYEMNELKAMVKYLPPHSGLRKLLVAAVVHTLVPHHYKQCELAVKLHYPPDLSGPILAGHRLPITGITQCSFHEHRSWEECESCGEFRDGQFMPPFCAGPSEGW